MNSQKSIVSRDVFYKGLHESDLSIISIVPKSDLHNHAGRGGRIEDLSLRIRPLQKPFKTLNEMQQWFEENVKANCPKGTEGYLYRVEAAFRQAARDNIQKLALSFGPGEVVALGGIENFINTMDALKKKHIEAYEFIPELSLLRSDITDNEICQMKELLSSGWFKSLDVCGNEMSGPLDKYVPLYRYARSKGLMLKVHVGEFGSANDVRHAVELLELDEVHHGIAAADSKEVMAYLRDNKIILNVCPTSNILLSRVESYEKHPIRHLVDAGVAVTINTDDLAIFNASVSDEYLNLFNSKVFTFEELDRIRLGGLTAYNKYSK
ncbi:adenosine deaminase [Acidaminobacter sp. JC074]|uniref:adenosine deaminase n=1 Tax=Acidaminobacter sp. JC074 TaxID=2530199 RepID=UPI001F10A301|nr:adenosine deaminase [Acidaminobacter sp. JC074]MCH4886269.1 adenosine deaminase [Acidaminobacter sp. JC074]